MGFVDLDEVMLHGGLYFECFELIGFVRVFCIHLLNWVLFMLGGFA